jgi:hypothetical protein
MQIQIMLEQLLEPLVVFLQVACVFLHLVPLLHRLEGCLCSKFNEFFGRCARLEEVPGLGV